MKKIILSGVLFLTALSGYSQLDRSVRPQAGTAPIINIQDSEVFTTSNGITVILSENHKLPKVSIRLVMGSDPMTEGSKAGLSDVAGQLITSGTSKRTKDQLDNEVDYIGATLSADNNSISLSCLSKHLTKGIELFTDVLYNANFPQSEFDRIIKQNESALMSVKTSSDAMAKNAVLKTIFPGGHPNGEIMTEATLGNIKKADVEDYYKKVFTPNGSYLVIVGDITKEQAKSLVDKNFASWKGGKAYKADLGAGVPSQGTRVLFVNKPGAVQSTVTVAFPVKMKPGDKNQIPLNVTNGILGGGGFGTRLMQNLREDKAYTYGCYSSLDISETGSFLTASGNFRNAVTDSAITQILKEIEGMSSAYVKDNEIGLTKSAMAGNFARSLENPQTIARFALNIIRYNLPKDYYKNYLQNLEKVSKEDVLDMAQQYFPTKNCYIIVVGNSEILDKLKAFDTDGIIEKLDAFGDAVKDMKKADISKEQLIEKYVLLNTVSPNMKAAQKKLSKIKSVQQEIELTTQQIPAPLLMTSYWVAPNKQAIKMEMQGMLIQREYFDGKKGASSNMQTGKQDYTAEQIEEKASQSGLYPELNYGKNNVNYELLGIENQNGADLYVLKITKGENETYEYFNTKDCQKVKTLTITKQDGETIEAVRTYGDYKEVNGLLFPHKVSIMAGPMGLSGKATKIEVNKSIPASAFQ